MAKRKKTTTTTTTYHRDFVKICAFWGMAISAVLYLISGILAFVARYTGEVGATLQSVASIFSLIANLAIVVAIAFPAYGYVRGRSRDWKIVYWILLAVFVLGVVFGALPTWL